MFRPSTLLAEKRGSKVIQKGESRLPPAPHRGSGVEKRRKEERGVLFYSVVFKKEKRGRKIKLGEGWPSIQFQPTPRQPKKKKKEIFSASTSGPRKRTEREGKRRRNARKKGKKKGKENGTRVRDALVKKGGEKKRPALVRRVESSSPSPLKRKEGGLKKISVKKRRALAGTCQSPPGKRRKGGRTVLRPERP